MVFKKVKISQSLFIFFENMTSGNFQFSNGDLCDCKYSLFLHFSIYQNQNSTVSHSYQNPTIQIQEQGDTCHPASLLPKFFSHPDLSYFFLVSKFQSHRISLLFSKKETNSWLRQFCLSTFSHLKNYVLFWFLFLPLISLNTIFKF